MIKVQMESLVCNDTLKMPLPMNMQMFAKKDILVCIDPGHAKNTPGKRAGSNPVFYEYLSNRRVARELARILQLAGFRTMFSCDLDSPVDLSLAQRAANAVKAGADLFISIHTNAHGDPSVRGTETFIHNNSQASLAIAQAVQATMVAAFKQPNRGVKRANFGVLRGTYKNMLSILTEADFFTNAAARSWMFKPEFDRDYANSVLRGVCNYYGVTIPSLGSPAPAPVKPEAPKSDDVGKSLLRVITDELWVYDKPDWSARTFTVKRGEAFTVARELTVNGSKMYQLISGLYITANSMYVEFDGVVASTPPAAAPAKKSNTVIASEIMNGEWDNDPVRAQRLRAAGYDAKAIQAEVNRLSRGNSGGGTTPQRALRVNDRVRINQSARTYATGQSIPSRIKGNTYTVQQTRSGQVLLKEIVSWVRNGDVTRV